MANQAYVHPRVGASWVLPPGPDAKHTVVRYRTDGTFTIAVNDLDIVAEFEFGDAVALEAWLSHQVQYEREARAEERIHAAAAKSS